MVLLSRRKCSRCSNSCSRCSRPWSGCSSKVSRAKVDGTHPHKVRLDSTVFFNTTLIEEYPDSVYYYFLLLLQQSRDVPHLAEEVLKRKGIQNWSLQVNLNNQKMTGALSSWYIKNVWSV